MLSSRFAGIPISSSTIDGPGVPQLLNRGEQTTRAVTGSGGRDHFGMVADIKSESLAGLRRNSHGIDISHETVRFWWNRFGPMFAAEIRKRRVAQMRGFIQWRWHLDEVFVKVNGKLCYLWRAVDHEGEVLETVVTAKRDKAAALKFLKRIMKKYGRPKSVVTDGLCSYPAAMREIGNADHHEVGRRLNNRAENSHQPFRRRERAMQRFRSAKTLQKFSSVQAQVQNHFNQG